MPTDYYNPFSSYRRPSAAAATPLWNGTGMWQPRPAAPMRPPAPQAGFQMPPQPTAARPSSGYNPLGMTAYRGMGGGRTAPGTPLAVGQGHSQAQLGSQIQQMVNAGLLSPAMKDYILQPISGGRGRFAGSDWQSEVSSRLSSATGINPEALSGVLGVAGAHGSSASDIYRATGFQPAPAAPNYRGYGAPSQGVGDLNAAMMTMPGGGVPGAGFASGGAYRGGGVAGGGGTPWTPPGQKPGTPWTSLSSILSGDPTEGEPEWIAKMRTGGRAAPRLGGAGGITGVRSGVLPGRGTTTTGYNTENQSLDMAGLFQ